jgi:hypothetical protein
MLSRWQFNLLTTLGVCALLLVVVNGALFTLNRDAQIALTQRQQFVQQSVALEGLYRDIVKALAELGTKGNDRQVLDILAAQGLSVTVNGAPTASADLPAAKAK